MKPKNIGKVILAGLVITFLARDSVGRGDDGESEHYEYKCNDCDRVDTEETDYWLNLGREGLRKELGI